MADLNTEGRVAEEINTINIKLRSKLAALRASCDDLKRRLTALERNVAEDQGHIQRLLRQSEGRQGTVTAATEAEPLPEYDTPPHAVCRDQRCYLQIYHTGPCNYSAPVTPAATEEKK